jgi:hypothetical protein
VARPRLRRWIVRIIIAAVVVGLAIQFVPYGWRHPNPPVVQDAPWPSPEARELAVAACYDCHSNESEWPWYSYIAPMSWMVRRDVEAGRDELNFSDWGEDGGEADDAAETILEGEMPPGRYTILHSGARLSDAEVDVLVAALEQMDEGGGNRGPGGGDDDDGDGDNSGPGGGGGDD